MGVRQIDDGRQGVVDDHGEAQSDAGGDHLLKESHGIGVEDIGRTADVIEDIQRQRGGGLVDDVGISQQCFERSGAVAGDGEAFVRGAVLAAFDEGLENQRVVQRRNGLTIAIDLVDDAQALGLGEERLDDLGIFG